MRLIAPALLVTLCLALLRCTAEAQEAAPAVAAPCHPKLFVDGWLRSEGYHLDDWRYYT